MPILRVYFVFCLFLLVGSLFACHTRDADEGSVRVKVAEIAGTYVIRLNNGTEHLVLDSNGTYRQEFRSSQPIEHTGRWGLENEVLDGSAVVLKDAIHEDLIPHANQPAPPPSTGELRLYVHRRSGKLVLARNEVADWYYERAQ